MRGKRFDEPSVTHDRRGSLLALREQPVVACLFDGFHDGVTRLHDNLIGCEQLLALGNWQLRGEVLLNGPTGERDGGGTSLGHHALGELLPDLVAGEDQDGRELANHGLEHVGEHALRTATFDGRGGIGVEAILDGIEVLRRDAHDEVIPGTIRVMEAVLVEGLRRLGDEGLQARKRHLSNSSISSAET